MNTERIRVTLQIEPSLFPFFQERYGRTRPSDGMNEELRKIKESREKKVETLDGDIQRVES